MRNLIQGSNMHTVFNKPLGSLIFGFVFCLYSEPIWANTDEDKQLIPKTAQQKQQEAVFTLYQNRAHLGDTNAQMELVSLYANGVGVKADFVMSSIYLSLASNHGNEKAKTLLSSFTPAQQKSINLAWQTSQIKEKYGFDALEKNIFPQFSDNKVILRKPRRLSSADNVYGSMLNPIRSYLSSRIIEFDVAADGKVRDIEVAMDFYSDRIAIANTIEEVSLFNYRPANQQGNRKVKVRSYGHRSVWAQRQLTKYYVQKRAPRFYKKVLKLQTAAMKDDPYAQYELAMLALVFPALEINTINYVQGIQFAAKAGIPEAQAEYAHLLLSGKMVNRDVELGFSYLLSAAQAGYARAQYKLARHLLSECEIIKDEHKAMFWLKQAMAQQEPYAKFWFARLSLKSTDKSLRNAALAKTLLASLSKQEEKNPNWYYFSAMAELQLGNNDTGLEFLSEGLALAKEYSWHIRKFEVLADKLKMK